MALRRIQHPASDEMFAVSKGDRTLSNLLPILGPPQQPLDFNVEDRMSHERWPVEKLFEGKQIYLENALSTMVKRTHNPFVTNLIMPLKYYNGITFIWTKWHGNRTLPAQTPVGAPPERVTQQRTRFRSTMNRYELGFVVNAETLDNPEGEFALALDLATVGVAFGDMFEQLGLTALLQRKNYHRERLRKFHEPYGNAADLFAWEKTFWDIIRKDPTGRGFYTLAEEVKKAQREIISSDVIVPEGVKSLLAAGSGNQDYYIFGDGARGNVRYGADNIGTSVATGLRVHVVREITIDKDGIRVAPLHRVKTIGDHFRLEDYTDCRPEEYRSCARTIKVFDMSESYGTFKPVDFLSALRHTERFEDAGNGSLLVKRHADLARNVQSKAVQAQLNLKHPNNPALDGFADMFLYKDAENTKYLVAKVLGQTEEQGIPYDAFRKSAETIAVRIVDTAGPGIRSRIAAGLNLINRIYGKKIERGDLELLAVIADEAAAAAAEAPAVVAQASPNVLPGNEFGSHDLDAFNSPTFNLPEAGGYLPPGFGSVAGLYTIASADSNSRIGKAIGEDTRRVADHFTQAVDTLFSALSPLFANEHMAFTGEHVPTHFKSSFADGSRAAIATNAKIAFAQNLLDSSKAPLWYNGASSSAGSHSQSADLGTPLADAIAGVESEAEALVLNAVRTALADSATPASRAAFSTSQSIAAFRQQYENSGFASAYSRYMTQRTSDAGSRNAAKNNKSFELFATSYLTDMLAGGDSSMSALASVVNGVVGVVSRGETISANRIEGQLASWATNPAPVRASNVHSGASAASAPGSVLTRLTVSPSALARALVKHPEHATTWALSSPISTNDVVNLSDHRAVSDAESMSKSSLVTLFAHSASSPFSYGGELRAGAKRSRDAYAHSGVLPANVPLDILGTKPADVNANFEGRFNRASAERDVLVNIGIKLLLLAPITYDTFERLYNADVRVPVSILGERPLRRYEAASCIFAAGGEQLGEIAWSKYDVHLSSNAMTKDFEGNASIWAAAVVKREERYFLAEDVLVTGYLGGESLKPFTAETFRPEQLDRNSQSVFFFLVPYGSLRGSEAVQRTHDIRGFYAPDLIEQRLTESARGLVVDRPHYPSALYYQQVYKFGRLRTISVDDADYFKVDGRTDNTITHQTMQWLWHHKNDKWDDAIMNTDHFGPNIYEGHGDLRVMGISKHYKDAGYNFSPVD